MIQDVMDVGGVEQVKLNLASGPTDARLNEVGVQGLGTDISVMRIDLGSFVNPNPNLRNSLTIAGTDGPDRIRISGTLAKGVSVSGTGSGAVLASGAQFLAVHGFAGDAVIDAGGLTAGTVETFIEVGDASPIPTPGGNDTLVGTQATTSCSAAPVTIDSRAGAATTSSMAVPETTSSSPEISARQR